MPNHEVIEEIEGEDIEHILNFLSDPENNVPTIEDVLNNVPIPSEATPTTSTTTISTTSTTTCKTTTAPFFRPVATGRFVTNPASCKIHPASDHSEKDRPVADDTDYLSSGLSTPAPPPPPPSEVSKQFQKDLEEEAISQCIIAPPAVAPSWPSASGLRIRRSSGFRPLLHQAPELEPSAMGTDSEIAEWFRHRPLVETAGRASMAWFGKQV